MKKIMVFVVASATLLGFVTQASAQAPRLGISSGNHLELYGHTNNWYQIKSSTNLISGWHDYENYFMASNTPQIKLIAMTNKTEFFRAFALVAVDNNSYCDTCAEHDNVNVALLGDVTNFTITATAVIDYDTKPCTNNCIDEPTANYPFPYREVLNYFSYNYGEVNVYRLSSWGRPSGMRFKFNGSDILKEDIHFIEVKEQIPGVNTNGIHFVFCSDGTMRLIPFSSIIKEQYLNVEVQRIKLGTSIIIGPASTERWPHADIESINLNTPNKTLFVVYREGGTALIDFGTVTITNAIVKVSVNYPTDKPFCTIRSMWVEDGNSDCDHVWWKELNGVVHDDPIMAMSGTVGVEWFFYRKTLSKHNRLSPDIRIKLK